MKRGLIFVSLLFVLVSMNFVIAIGMDCSVIKWEQIYLSGDEYETAKQLIEPIIDSDEDFSEVVAQLGYDNLGVSCGEGSTEDNCILDM